MSWAGSIYRADGWRSSSPTSCIGFPAFWEDPEAFDPDRFLPERSADRPKFVYLPFGAGPRQCIGSHFALIEAQLVVATLAQGYRLQLVPRTQGRAVASHHASAAVRHADDHRTSGGMAFAGNHFSV